MTILSIDSTTNRYQKLVVSQRLLRAQVAALAPLFLLLLALTAAMLLGSRDPLTFGPLLSSSLRLGIPIVLFVGIQRLSAAAGGALILYALWITADTAASVFHHFAALQGSTSLYLRIVLPIMPCVKLYLARWYVEGGVALLQERKNGRTGLVQARPLTARNLALQFLGVSYPKMVGLKKLKPYCLAVVAFLIDGIGYWVYFRFPSSLLPKAVDWTGPESDLLSFLAALLGGVITVGLGKTAFGHAALLRHRARAALLYSITEARETDRRAPVLFLRSFRSDPLLLEKGRMPWLLRHFDRDRPPTSLESLLESRFSHIGPVVAIGNPRDRFRPVGAVRVYVGDEDWQREVAELMSEADTILICVDATEGILWELEAIQEGGMTSKTVFWWAGDASVDAGFLRKVLLALDVDEELCQYSADGELVESRLEECIKDSAVLAVQIRGEQCLVIVAKQGTELEYELAARVMAARRSSEK